MCESTDVVRIELARHGHRTHAECKLRQQRGNCGRRAGVAGQVVEDESDFVPARDLALHQIEHMTKQAAERGAEDVENVELWHELDSRGRASRLVFYQFVSHHHILAFVSVHIVPD
jgi:hypothetical protein